MGKTQKGALWLRKDKCSPYDFYQYWRNVDDADVNKCLRMLTFLPMEEVNRLSALKDKEINHAKEVLAWNVTALVHSAEEADKAQAAARALFAGGADAEVPSTKMERAAFEGEGVGLLSLLKELKLIQSNGDGFRTIEQGGLSLNGERVNDAKMNVTLGCFDADGKLLIKKGKKTFHRVEL